MTMPYTGCCACGAISYAITGEPVAMNDCQCRICQRDSGTGHGSYLTFVGAEVETRGAPSFWEFVGDSGTRRHRAFCPACGTAVYMTFPTMPEVFVIRAGSLDDPSRYVPQMVFWTEAAQPWDLLDPKAVKFARMPPPTA